MNDHDPTICRCLDDDEIVRRIRTQGVHDGIPLIAARCGCTCSKCVERKISYDGYIRRGNLERRLLKIGVNVQDYADLIWVYVADQMDSWLKKRVSEEVAAIMQNMAIKTWTRLSPANVYDTKSNGRE